MSGSLVTAAWRLVGFRKEEAAFSDEGQPWKY
jgi:hypothetical protein